MFRRIYARCELEIDLIAKSPLLVQGSQALEGPATFYKARDPADNGREKYCIPASTLKGVWRSSTEQILRSFDQRLACDPFAEKGAHRSCSKRAEVDNLGNSPATYGKTCPACRLFGSTAHTGLLRMQDAWASGNPRLGPQTGIAIDRFTGGVKTGALYQYEPLAAGARFSTRVVIDNFEFWQLGLLALVNREMNDGRIRIGSGTRKGMGHVEAQWRRAQFRYARSTYEQADAQRGATGGGVLASAQMLAARDDSIPYPDPEPWLLPELQAQPPQSWADAPWLRFVVEGEALSQLMRDCVERALAPKLKRGAEGFAYEREVAHA